MIKMIKTVKRVIALTAMIVLGATLVFAQQSNTYIATFGQFKTDADRFFHVNDWNAIDFNGFFGYSRFGANIPAGILDVGAAAKVGSLYMGLYYNGNVLGYSDGTSYSQKLDLYDPLDPDGKKKESITLNMKQKKNPKATYGALVGIRDLGFKFTFEDDLEVAGAYASGTPGAVNESWTGALIPKLEVGLPGTLYMVTLKVPIVYDRTETATPTAAAGTATFGTTTIGDTTITNRQDRLLDADGNYVQTDIGLRFAFPIASTTLYLWNNLRFNIYGVPGRDLDGKETVYMGVANVNTDYSAFNNAGGENRSIYNAIYDSRFWLEDEINPSIYIANGAAGNFAYAAYFSMPITLGFTNHSMNATIESKSDIGTYGKKIEVKDYYKRFDFDMGIKPRIDAGVQWKPADILSLQGGIGLDLFKWSMASRAQTEVKAPSDPIEAGKQATAMGADSYYSDDSSVTEFTFGYPGLEFALGFTVSFKKTASLDFVYINKFNPSIAGLVYKSVGEGLGSGDTSVVLSIKF
jgi:hypothetical protein